MFERLWNGWRSSYVSVDSGRLPTRRGRAARSRRSWRRVVPDDETNIVHRGGTCFAILNAYPYGTGHLLVLPYREVADLDDLDDDETRELWATVTDAVAAVTSAYAPDGVNVGLNLGRAAGRFGQSNTSTSTSCRGGPATPTS